jgi:N-methylhydantoinase A
MDESDVGKIAVELMNSGIHSVAVSLLFAFMNPVHELRIREILQQKIPGIRVSLSSEVCPEIREYERTSTVAINAYLTQTVQEHLESLEEKLYQLGMKSKLQVMQSSGGVTECKFITGRPVSIFLSGPAGGVVASSYVGNLMQEKESNNIIAVDMGGTSFDITLLTSGIVPLSMRSMIHGWHIIAPTIDIQTIGSGGGSIAWVDAGKGLHVGPQSAGSNPGPASYMKGGKEPTVTDADILLGYIDPDYFLGGEMRLNKAAAEEAVRKVGEQVGLTPLEMAAGIYSIVGENMLGGMRLSTLQCGYDPREYTLFVFGGAGGAHVPYFAPELGINHIIIPRDASVFSALGLTISETRFDFTKNISKNTGEMTVEELLAEYDKLRKQGNDSLEGSLVDESDRYFLLRADMKYPGEFNEFIVDIPAGFSTMQEIVERFERYHKEQYGYAEDALPDIVNIRLSAFGRSGKPNFIHEKFKGKSAKFALKGTRQAYFHELRRMVDTKIYDGQVMENGNTVMGPAIIEMLKTTIVIRPEQICQMDELGNFNIQCKEVKAK